MERDSRDIEARFDVSSAVPFEHISRLHWPSNFAYDVRGSAWYILAIPTRGGSYSCYKSHLAMPKSERATIISG